MPSNLRSAPISGYITDSAGNILRNVEVAIKEDTPLSLNLVDVAKSNDSGYFRSKPIKNGVYHLFESGTDVSVQYHPVLPYCIQAYAADPVNLPAADSIKPFSYYTDPARDINLFRHYLQIEEAGVNVFSYGNRFPLWDLPRSHWYTKHPFFNIDDYHEGFTDDSRITHSRFDIEMFVPLIQNASHHRVRWMGVPSIRFYGNSNLILPLDYLSIVPNRPWYYRVMASGITHNFPSDTSNQTIRLLGISAADRAAILVGDIVRVKFLQPGTTYKYFWGIAIYIDTSDETPNVILKRWRSTNASQNVGYASDISVYSGANSKAIEIRVFQGIPSQIASIVQSVGERYTVTENQQAQNLFQSFSSVTENDTTEVTKEELYSYPG